MRPLILLLLAACGAETPPFSELPLRDTLQAEARVLARLTSEERALLRDRFIAALADTQADQGRFAPGDDAAVTRFDTARLQTGHDVAPHVVVVDSASATTVTQHVLSLQRGETATRDIPFDVSRDDATTATLVRAALRGAAGTALLRVAAGKTITRAEHAPFAVAADAQAVAVNPAWLVIMAEPDTRDPSPSAQPVTRQSALAVGTVSNVSTCQTDVRAACAGCATDATLCDAALVTSDYAGPQAECAAVVADASVALHVCQTLALSRAEVLTCMQRNEPDCVRAGPFTTNAFWKTFSANAVCTKNLERCAADPKYVQQISCDACAPSNCGKSLCNPSFSCASPSCSSSGCSAPSAGCKVCAQTPEDPSLPFVSIGFALLPLVYFARAARRRR